jgi:hypothetical protein
VHVPGNPYSNWHSESHDNFADGGDVVVVDVVSVVV